METRTETVEQRLLRVLRELAAPHAISPEGRAAILPLVPLAEQIEQAARERGETVPRREFEDACTTIAKMHGAVVGFGNGPRRGVVEDVEDAMAAQQELIAQRDRAQEDAANLRRQLQAAHERAEEVARRDKNAAPPVSPAEDHAAKVAAAGAADAPLDQKKGRKGK